MTTARTLIEKIWSSHVIAQSDGIDLVHIDRSLLTDLSGTIGLEEMAADEAAIFSPALQLAIPDHVIASGDDGGPDARRDRFVGALERLTHSAGIRHFARGSGAQGIVHVSALERGFTLPGVTLVCGDSHTSTHGAVGALAWGIGSTEVKHVLASQTLWMKRPLLARIVLSGDLNPGVFAKDVALYLIAQLGADWGREHAIEFSGDAVETMSIEARATLCNLAVELGARIGIVAPDETTFAYLQGLPEAPHGETWDMAMAAWRTLTSDKGAVFDKEARVGVGVIGPQITWGTSPEHAIALGETIPSGKDPAIAQYMGVTPNAPLDGARVDFVFIGSCANGRLEDLRVAARVAEGRRVAAHVTAWIVPGSEKVKALAEAEGLDAVFRDAGFEWRAPGCSMCVGVNGDIVPPGKRCVSTSNRNFVGRQGPGARTHLASPATAAACALAGFIVANGVDSKVAP